jgi:hypothetical protein
MAEQLKPYDVTLNGVPTTLRLSDADAKKLGLIPAKTAPGKPAPEAPAPEVKEAAPPQNKSRSAARK